MITDKHTHRQTDTLTTLLRSPIGGGVISERNLELYHADNSEQKLTHWLPRHAAYTGRAMMYVVRH